MPIINRIAEFRDDMQGWRRDIHRHPETAFEEFRTAKIVAEKLAEWGIEVHDRIGQTGVIGVVHGANGPGGPGIGLRADMDALNLTELNQVDHCSGHDGKMHACGHDGHTAMLLGAARYLAETRNFEGTAYVIFQPAEEGAGGGLAMVEDKMFERFPMATVWGMHNWPTLPAGQFAVHKREVMAAADLFRITVNGKGAHGAMPDLGVDPVLIGAHIIVALQSLVSRNTSPLDSAVVSATAFTGSDAFNVIPDTAFLGGTVRAFRPDVRERMEQGVIRIARSIAEAMGGSADVDYHRGYPPTINTEPESAFAAKVAEDVAGDGNVRLDCDPSAASEDFSYMLNERPGCYLWIGGSDGVTEKSLHNPHYDFNDEVLTLGASYWARLVETALPRAS
jgi:hippurate hydrolase